jgi:hypothetical protein
MAKTSKFSLSQKESKELIQILQMRFEKNMNRHKSLIWQKIQLKLEHNSEKLWSLKQMEESGGEPDVVDYQKGSDSYVFMDCSPESPVGRRSCCFDEEALNSRKENKPEYSAWELAKKMGIEVLNEEQYRYLQSLGKFDTKTSSWIQTPAEIRKLGGALFADFRYNHVFIYHNGASSYYAARAFRGILLLN